MRLQRGAAIAATVSVLLSCAGKIESTQPTEAAPSSSPEPPSGTIAAAPDPAAPGPGKSQADQTCTPGSPRKGGFDPDCVYAFGAKLGELAVFYPTAPGDQADGLVNVAQDRMFIRPTDGRLLYVGGDSTLFAFTESGSPADVVQPPCSGKLAGLFADDGALVYECNGGYVVEGAGDLELAGQIPLAFGSGRAVLIGPQVKSLAVVRAGVVTKVVGLDANDTDPVLVARSRPSGGFLAAVGTTTTRLVSIDEAGTGTYVGTFDRSPNFGTYPNACALESTGALVCIQTLEAPAHSTFGVVRSRTDGPAEVIYDQRTGPIAFYGHAPVTGP